MQAAESNQVVTLPPLGNPTPEQSSDMSLTHWVWPPFKDISNMGPWGINSQLGYHDQRWTRLERCVPYPLGNLTSTTVDRAEMGSLHDSGFVMNQQAVTKSLVKYALHQAQELGETYGPEGLRVLVPFTGVDDVALVERIVKVVQPFKYAIHEMPFEFTDGAEQRIAQSKLNSEEREMATALAKVMLHGAQLAIATADRQYEELITMMSDAAVGKPGISNPTVYHRWLCGQLNKQVPERINRMQQGESNSKAIEILATRALKEESAAEMMMEELRQEREARKKLEQRLSDLENKPKARSA